MELDIDAEIASHKSIKEINELTAEYKSLSKDLTLVERDIPDGEVISSQRELRKLSRKVERLEQLIDELKNKLASAH